MLKDRTAITLTSDEYAFIRYGPSASWVHAFTTKKALRAAWKAHREWFMMSCHHGHRCWAWWELEGPKDIDYPGYEQEQAVLFDRGLLDEAERAELIREWKREFDLAEGLDEVTRRKRLAGIPDALVRAWEAEAAPPVKPAA
jgi:hypothetical protein